MKLASLIAVMMLVGCSSEAPATTSDGSCRAGSTTFANGYSGKCPDGCNSCLCRDGVLSSTAMACGCSDATGFHSAGSTWTCPDGCNTCTCNADYSITSTRTACLPDASPDTAGDAATSDADAAADATDLPLDASDGAPDARDLPLDASDGAADARDLPLDAPLFDAADGG